LLRGQTTSYRVLQTWSLNDPVRIWAAGELSEEVLTKSVLGKLLLEKGDDFNLRVVGAGEVFLWSAPALSIAMSDPLASY